MTICVDELFTAAKVKRAAQRYGNIWCHLFTDDENLEELHRFAERLGLKRSYFQPHRTLPHYDLIPKKRALAIKLGAKALTPEENKAILLQAVARRCATTRQEQQQ